MQSSALSRTSSAASISSDDSIYLKQVLGFEPRRTRKRFTSTQLMKLEQLFHQSSHPTREEREEVARAAGMEMKSVTIWFQNKRQTERKALHHVTTQSAVLLSVPLSSPSALSYESTSTSASTVASSSSAPHLTRTHARTLSAHTPRNKRTPPHARPSLDRVATRSESRLPPPRTPTRPRDPHASPWDNMPSSPLAPPASPPAHDLVAFLGGSRTLEWACAAARLAGKEKEKERERGGRGLRVREREQDRDRGEDQHRSQDRDRGGEGELTEEDDVEAVTPEGSLGVFGAARWQGRGAHSRPSLTSMHAPAAEGEDENLCGEGPEKEVQQDEDMMRAALALCGLGRRNG